MKGIPPTYMKVMPLTRSEELGKILFNMAQKLVQEIAPTKQTNALHRSTRKTEEATARESFKGNINPN